MKEIYKGWQIEKGDYGYYEAWDLSNDEKNMKRSKTIEDLKVDIDENPEGHQSDAPGYQSRGESLNESKLLIERFQQLAGIKPLYELNEEDKHSISDISSKVKDILGKTKGGTEKLVKQLQASSQYKKIEAEIKKELQSGDKSQAVISKLMNVIEKVAEILARSVSTKEKRDALTELLKVLQYIPAGATVYALLTNLLNFIPAVSIPTFAPGIALMALIIILIARVMLFLYKIFGNTKNEGLNEEDLVNSKEKSLILKLLQTQ